MQQKKNCIRKSLVADDTAASISKNPESYRLIVFVLEAPVIPARFLSFEIHGGFKAIRTYR